MYTEVIEHYFKLCFDAEFLFGIRSLFSTKHGTDLSAVKVHKFYKNLPMSDIMTIMKLCPTNADYAENAYKNKFEEEYDPNA
jgi:hypothetical protein